MPVPIWQATCQGKTGTGITDKLFERVTVLVCAFSTVFQITAGLGSCPGCGFVSFGGGMASDGGTTLGASCSCHHTLQECPSPKKKKNSRDH